MREQTYANHKRYFPLFHFVTIPLLTINLIVRIVVAVRNAPSALAWWEIVIALALLGVAFSARLMALAVQNRVIRLEERLRLERVLPDDLRNRAGELRTSQLIAMRFCPDEELPELCRAVLNGELREQNEIKRRVKSWRPDWLRA